MTNSTKVAIIAVAGAILAVALYLYFSPYQQCVRAKTAQMEASGLNKDGWGERHAKTTCANSN